MINESHPWKRELGRLAATLDRSTARKLRMRDYFPVERAVFLSAFIARKLFENGKITDAVRRQTINANEFTPFQRLSDRVSMHFGGDVTDQYDLEQPQPTLVGAAELCSQIIHSFAFVPAVGSSGCVVGFYVNSYRAQDLRLLYIEMKKYSLFISTVAANDVVNFRVWKDKSGMIQRRLD